MYPSTYSSITRLACAVSLGLIATPAIGLGSLGTLVTDPTLAIAPRATTRRVEDDRGSGRLSHDLHTPNWVSFRGSGRIDPQSPVPTSRHTQVAYRGSGRITTPTGTA